MKKELQKLYQQYNWKPFGKYERLVVEWCVKFKMTWVLYEFKELFNTIEKQAKEEVFDDFLKFVVPALYVASDKTRLKAISQVGILKKKHLGEK
jgi:hypothetical protein